MSAAVLKRILSQEPALCVWLSKLKARTPVQRPWIPTNDRQLLKLQKERLPNANMMKRLPSTAYQEFNILRALTEKGTGVRMIDLMLNAKERF
ncbi:hypothetical protein GX50_06196 [[Emmonsia] crescens]|uniref:Uncharacterized protein n=1 Tax=[Emmonsia] crescens TaxID=73230 RepID=A0A2B7ZD02_9EURO|nr:hypothetical protein GX50_06196 [Emmonsia crescens]